MRNLFFLIASFASLCSPFSSQGQAVLNADGPGNTYELINSVLAPGYDVVENPECVHPSFGRHIAEVFDADLNKFVFEFYSHVSPDNDRCVTFDRQRVEIKTYDQSPDSLIGLIGETVTYKWRMKIPAGFQPSSSFTHIHQVKPVNGDDGNPLFTLTARKGTPNKLELIYVASETSGSNKVRIVNLSLFENVWVEVIERIVVGANGSYAMTINRVSDGASILSYSNADIATIRPDNSFIRPKWGIYRSLNTPADLRDESIRYSDISIDEGAVVLPLKLTSFNAGPNDRISLLRWVAIADKAGARFNVERSADAVNFTAISHTIAATTGEHSYEFFDRLPLQGNNHYRLKLTDADGGISYSETKAVRFEQYQAKGIKVYPNPVQDKLQLIIEGITGILNCQVTDTEGRAVFSEKGTQNELNELLNRRVSTFKPGIYIIRIYNGDSFYSQKFVKQ